MVLVSHRYKFIYLKNYKVAGSSVEAFFGQFCIDPATKSSYNFRDGQYNQIITQYGILGCNIPCILHNGRTICTYDINTNTSIWINHRSALHIKKELGENIFNQYIKFCVIRNPYDSMVSSYYWDIYINNITCDFKTYCKTYYDTYYKHECIFPINMNDDIAHDNYTKWLKEVYNRNNLNRILINDTEICNFYIRYEYLIDDIIKLLDILDITDYNIDLLPNHKSGLRPINTSYKEYYDEETRNIVYQLFKKEFELFNYDF